MKDWIFNNKKGELIPPDHCLVLSKDVQRWLHNLSEAGKRYEETGDEENLQYQIELGKQCGYIEESTKRSNHDIEVNVSLPRVLTKEGERLRDVIIQRFFIGNILDNRFQQLAAIFMTIAFFYFCWGITVGWVIRVFT